MSLNEDYFTPRSPKFFEQAMGRLICTPPPCPPPQETLPAPPSIENNDLEQKVLAWIRRRSREDISRTVARLLADYEREKLTFLEDTADEWSEDEKSDSHGPAVTPLMKRMIKTPHWAAGLAPEVPSFVLDSVEEPASELSQIELFLDQSKVFPVEALFVPLIYDSTNPYGTVRSEFIPVTVTGTAGYSEDDKQIYMRVTCRRTNVNGISPLAQLTIDEGTSVSSWKVVQKAQLLLATKFQ